jgi:hypothetical protein
MGRISALSAEKQKAVQDWLVKTHRRPPCPVCSSQDFTVADVVTLGGMPMVPVVCDRCSRVELFWTNNIVGF